MRAPLKLQVNFLTRHEARGTRHEARGTRHEARGTRHEARDEARGFKRQTRKTRLAFKGTYALSKFHIHSKRFQNSILKTGVCVW